MKTYLLKPGVRQAIAKAGETDVAVAYNAKAWLDDYPAGVPQLMVTRPDGVRVPVTVAVVDNLVTGQVPNELLANPGMYNYVFVWVSGTTQLESGRCECIVLGSDLAKTWADVRRAPDWAERIFLAASAIETAVNGAIEARNTAVDMAENVGEYVEAAQAAQTAAETAQAGAEAAGQAAAASEANIEQILTNMEQTITDAETALNGIEDQKNTMIASIAAIAEMGTDPTLTQEGVAADAKAVGDLKIAYESIKSAFTKVELAETYPFDLSGVVAGTWNISPSTGYWTKNSNYLAWVFERPASAKFIAVTGGTDGSNVALLKSDNRAASTVPDYATGWTQRSAISTGDTAFYTLPDDCKYIWINGHTSDSVDYTPYYVGFTGNEFDNDYIRIEYAESNGTQYIDTGVKLNQDSRVKIRANLTDFPGAYIFGGRTSTSSKAFGVAQGSSGQVYAGYDAYEYIDFYPSKNVHEYDFNGANLYVDGTLINTFDAATFTTPNNAYLFATSATSSSVFYGKCRIYSCQIFDGNGNLLRDFIPVIRRSDSAVMMYDRVNKIAYGANGGTLTGGPTVSAEDNLSSITSNTTRISRIEARLDETHDRDYIQTEADRVSKKVHDVQTDQTLTFIACSDLHYAVAVGSSDDVTVKASQEALRDMTDGILAVAKQTHIDFYACFGDVIYQWQSHGANYENGVTEMFSVTKLLSEAFKNNPQIRMVGNHDPNCENSQGKEFSAYMMNSFAGIYSEMLKKDEDFPYGGYGYHDFDRQKVRFIVLNTSFYTPETDLSNGATVYDIGVNQAYWLCTALDLSEKADADEWQIVISSHVTMDSAHTEIRRYTAVLDAYLSGSTWSYSSKSYNFSGKNAAQLVLYLNGHTHAYKFRNMTYVNSSGVLQKILPLANLYIPNALPGREEVSTDGETYTKTANSAESTSFQVITVDFVNKVVYAHHYGAGIDIVMHYEPSTESSLSTELTEPVWASVDDDVATVSDGEVTPVAEGYVMIWAKSETDNCIECWNYQSVV